MAAITAKDVAALRAKTGIGMMECKKALVETDGDMEAAIKLISSALADAVIEGKQGEAVAEEAAPAEEAAADAE